ncbi:MAG: hypothetical protein IT305_30270 [Chloroflexi bacterium]|nr:hypothetical protein [Chloroflexota bacterium]
MDEYVEDVATDAEDAYHVTLETTVGEALFTVMGAAEIFERHGCQPTIECTDEHHIEYMLADVELVCHIDDSVALMDELNAAIDAEEASRAEMAWAAA